MKNDLQPAIEAAEKKLATLKAFAAKHDMNGVPCGVTTHYEDGRIVISLHSATPAQGAALFGPEGFRRVDSGYGWWNYEKTVDGVIVSLYHAEPITPAPATEVAPELLLGAMEVAG